jgi:hypothetical protein
MKENKKILIWFFIVFFLMSASLFYWQKKQEGEGEVMEIGNRKMKVEVVADVARQEKGLSERNSLCSDCGMLFIFPEKKRQGFWMKNMNFNLDILWVADGKVVYIAKNVDHLGDEALRIIEPNSPADMVLEVNAGFCDKYNIKVGDNLEKNKISR